MSINNLEFVVKSVLAMDRKMEIISTLFSYTYYEQISKNHSCSVLPDKNYIFKTLFLFDMIYIQL